MNELNQKIMNQNDGAIIREEADAAGQKIVFTNGCFDLLHVGHSRYLRMARELGDKLVIGLNSDDSIRRLKGNKRPIVSEEQRAEMLASFYFVDSVILFEEDTPLDLIKSVKPDFLGKGGDWNESQIVGADFVKSIGGEIRSIRFVDGMATTNIIQQVLEKYCH